MKAINAYILELKYWADLSVLGYFWTFIKPCAFYLTTYFIISINEFSRDAALLHALQWTVFWFSALNSVQSCKRLRKFVVYGSFGAYDLLIYSVVDMVFNLTILLIPYFVFSQSVNFAVIPSVLFSLALYFISCPIFLYVGVLSVNASDFSSTFSYVPMIFLGMITHGWSGSLRVISPFLAILGREYDEKYLMVTLACVALLSMLVFKKLHGKLHALYSEAIV